MKEQRAFLWPRLVAGIHPLPEYLDNIRKLFSEHDVDCFFDDDHILLVDISHWQVQNNDNGSAEWAIARLQHLLNLHVSPLHYSLGIGNDNLWAYHAANSTGPGKEKWVLPWQVKTELGRTPVTVLRVLDKRMPEFFNQCGKNYCDELVEFGKDFLVRRFAGAGEMLWCLLQGKICQYPDRDELTNGDMRWRMSLPVRTRSMRALSAHLWRLYTAVNRNLERLHRHAGQLELDYQGSEESGFNHPAVCLRTPVRHRRDFNRHLEKMLVNKNGITRFQITASRLSHPAGQLDLF